MKERANFQNITGTHGLPVKMSAAENAKAHKDMVKNLIKQGNTMGDMIPILYNQP